MCAFLLKIDDPNVPIENKGEAFLEGGMVLIQGMLKVFAVLCIIWACLFLVRKIIELATGQVQTTEKAPDPIPVPQAPAPAPISADGELIAVIAAAIAAAEHETGHTGNFRVVSFRRVNK